MPVNRPNSAELEETCFSCAMTMKGHEHDSHSKQAYYLSIYTGIEGCIGSRDAKDIEAVYHGPEGEEKEELARYLSACQLCKFALAHLVICPSYTFP